MLRFPLPASDRFLDRLFLLRHTAEAHLDRLFLATPLPQGLTVTLYNEADAGFGDVAFATKLLSLLARHTPEVDLALVSTDREKQSRFGLPQSVTLYGVEEFRSMAKPAHRHPTLVVSAPGIFDHCRARSAVLELLGVASTCPFLYIAEYGSIRQLRDDAFGPLVGTTHTSAYDAYLDQLLDQAAASAQVAADEIGHRAGSGEIVTTAGVPGASDPTRGGVRTIGHLLDGLSTACAANPLLPWLQHAWLTARSCGLAPGELGIHIDEPLAAESRALAARSASDRLTPLLDLHDRVLAQTLLGADSDLARYAEHSALYLGYAHGGIELFVEEIAILEAGRRRRIDIVVPNPRRPDGVRDEILSAAGLQRLARLGVATLQIIGNACAETRPGETATLTLSLAGGVREREGKTLRLITRFPLPHEDMRRLLLASAPETMVSGDQSFSDAVSADKRVLIIEPVYCQTYHLDSVLALAKRHAPDAHTVLELGMRYRRAAGDHERLVQALGETSLPAQYAEFNAHIHTQHNANAALIALIKRALWTAIKPELAEEQRKLWEAAWRTFDVAQGIALDAEELVATLTRSRSSSVRA
jgi:hypothetical protein